MGQIQGVGAVGANAAPAHAAAVQQTGAGPARAEAPQKTDAGQAAAHDGVHFSDELEEEGGPDGAHEGAHARHGDEAHRNDGADQAHHADQADDPKAAEERKRKEDEAKLKELERQINDKQGQLEEAVKKGDQAEATRLQNELGDLLAQRQELQQKLQPREQQPGRAPAAGGNQGGAAPAGGAPPVGGAPQGGAPQQGGFPSQGGFPMQGGAPQQSGGFPPNMMRGGPGNPAGVQAESSSPIPPINLQGNDRKTADFINNYLAQKGSPAASQHAGELMVQYGKQYKVDPLILLSIAGQETQFGKTGIGANGMLGVGAYDNDPNNATRNPTFSGVANQIRIGAQTFAKLRERGGSSDTASIADQTAAVNRAGWASDPNWHSGVNRMYAQVSRAAQDQA